MRERVGRMNVIDFIPVYGTVRAIERSYYGDLSLSEQVFLGFQVGLTTFVTTVAAGETLGFTRGTVSLAQFGVAAALSPFGVAAAVGVGTVLFSEYMSQHVPYSQPTHLTPEYFDMRRQAGY